jgi:hypothetical protein
MQDKPVSGARAPPGGPSTTLLGGVVEVVASLRFLELHDLRVHFTVSRTNEAN